MQISFNQINTNLLQNKNILITGATRGIGRELAIHCAKYGANTILIGKNIKKLEQVYDEITSLKLPNPAPEPALVPLNLAGATPTDYQELAITIGQKYGHLDGLIHNAATMGIKTQIIHYDILKWYETVQVNLNSAFIMTQMLLPLLRLSKQASLIFTTANEGLHGEAYQGAYGVCKAAIKNFMEILAAECEENTNLRVNAINPCKIYSGIYTQNYPATAPTSLPNPIEIMPLYLYLLGDFTKKIHGQTIKFESISSQSV